jgi:hypothetical protein
MNRQVNHQANHQVGLSQETLDNYVAELSLGAIQGTLTQKRYDDILTELLPHINYPDARMTLIGCGNIEWRAKYLNPKPSESRVA